MPPADRILGYGDIAAITGKSRRTVRRWFQEGRLPRVKFGGLVGCWERDLIAALDWRGGGSLMVDDIDGADCIDHDALDGLPGDRDADRA